MPRARKLTKADVTLSKADVTLTVTLILVANQRPLTIDEIQEAFSGAGYDVPLRETMHILNEGPFRCCDGKWLIAMAHA